MSEGVMKSYAKELYEKEVVVKAAYAFTDRAYIHLDEQMRKRICLMRMPF